MKLVAITRTDPGTNPEEIEDPESPNCQQSERQEDVRHELSPKWQA